MTLHTALTPEPSFAFAVMVAVPAVSAVILPFWTDTFVLSELVHTSELSVASAGVTVAFICPLSPTFIVSAVWSNVIPLTGITWVSVEDSVVFSVDEPVVDPVEPVLDPDEGFFVAFSVVVVFVVVSVVTFPPDSPLIVLSSDDTSLFGTTFCAAFSSSVPLFFTYR